MGHIAEPKGVDFLIKSPPLTDEERKELSEHIRARKSELDKKSVSKRKQLTKEKPKA
jgi:hypothetical protein